MKVLVTGFEPFGGMTENPTSQLVSKLQEEKLTGFDIHCATLPVVYDKCVQQLITIVENVSPDVIICCGLAFGRTSVTLERIGINIKDTAHEGQKGDNEGDKPVDEKIISNGPDGLFATLPIRKMTKELIHNNIPAQISNTAGTYICNNTLYGILHYIATNHLDMKAGFIHFPATPNMTIEKPNVASMAIETQYDALKIMIKALKE